MSYTIVTYILTLCPPTLCSAPYNQSSLSAALFVLLRHIQDFSITKRDNLLGRRVDGKVSNTSADTAIISVLFPLPKGQ
jgi:hypothetical protein